MPESEPENDLWGIGIEREMRIVKNDGRTFQVIPNVDYTEDNYHYFNSSFNHSSRSNSQTISNVHKDGSVGGSYEIATDGAETGWQRTTIESQSEKVRKTEKFLLKKAKEGARLTRRETMSVYPFGFGFDNYSNRFIETGNATGSYHFWWTIPHNKSRLRSDNSYERKKIGQRNKFLNQFQWLEPLFLAKLGGGSSINSGDSGTNTEASVRQLGSGYAPLASVRPEYVVRNDDERSSRITNSTRTALRNEGIMQNVGFTNGADFRTNAGTRGKLPIEIRFFDDFDSQTLPEVLKSMVYISSNAIDRNAGTDSSPITSIDSSQLSTSWDNDFTNAATAVMKEGWNAYLPEEYVKKVETNLGLENIARTSEGKIQSLRASDVLDRVMIQLHAKNKDNEISKLMISKPENRAEVPKILNVNRKGWDFYFRVKLRNEPETKEKFAALLTFLSEMPEKRIEAGNDLAENPGFRYILRQKMGDEYSDEDTRDILDLLESKGIVSLERNDDGSIKMVTIANLSDAEMQSKLNAMVDDMTFYSGEFPEPTIDQYGDVDLETLRYPIAGASAAMEVERPTIVQLGQGRRFRRGERVRIRQGIEVTYTLALAQRDRTVFAISSRMLPRYSRIWGEPSYELRQVRESGEVAGYPMYRVRSSWLELASQPAAAERTYAFEIRQHVRIHPNADVTGVSRAIRDNREIGVILGRDWVNMGRETVNTYSVSFSSGTRTGLIENQLQTAQIGAQPTPAGQYLYNVGQQVRITHHRRRRELINRVGQIIDRRISHGRPLYNLRLSDTNVVVRDMSENSLQAATATIPTSRYDFHTGDRVRIQESAAGLGFTRLQEIRDDRVTGAILGTSGTSGYEVAFTGERVNHVIDGQHLEHVIPVAAVIPTPRARPQPMTIALAAQNFRYAIGQRVRIRSHRTRPGLVGRDGTIVQKRLAHGRPLYNVRVSMEITALVIRDISENSLVSTTAGGKMRRGWFKQPGRHRIAKLRSLGRRNIAREYQQMLPN